MSFKVKVLRLLGVVVLLAVMSSEVFAHGERAQLASMRMRTMHWFDVKVEPLNAKVGDLVVLTGKFVPSVHWPEQLPNTEDTVFLNIGVPGPKFIRVHSEINGVPMIRSTALKQGELYEFKVVARARVAGRYHIHPLINVKDAGTLVGKGAWVEVAEAEGDAPFVNEITTMQGDVINLETYGLEPVKFFHVVWLVIGLAFLIYWLVLKKEVFIPRYIRIANMGNDSANSLITRQDFFVSGVFFTLTLAVILGGYLWAESKHPITIPLQTGKVEVVGDPVPTGGLEVDVESARYELTGRSLEMRTRMKNTGTSPLRIAEFITANIRFINSEASSDSVFYPGEEMVAGDGLSVSVDVLAPGEEVEVILKAEDALWEKYRMTGLIYDPDSRFAGMLFYYDDNGNRFFQEIGGAILPSFF